MLGELEVSDGEVDLPIRGAKQRALLLLLLVRARETVQAERLADELWGDDPPAGGANALQALVSKLRRALGPLSEVLVTGPGGYRLEVADDDIDSRGFEAAGARARAALDSDDVAGAAEELEQALAMWRGPALDGADDEGLLRREAARLEELRWAVLEDRCDVDLRRGRHAELVGELEHLVSEAPLRERLHGFLMLALYRSGRQAEALRAYQSARDVLGEELGLDPGPELRALESAILAQDPALELIRPDPSMTVRRRSNLTPALSSFIGRVADLEALEALATDQRLVTVVGPGGAGKTRLAHEVGQRRRSLEDVWMVELAAIRDPVGVADAVVTALHVPDGVGAALDRVAEHVGDRDTLLLLDNCEHVIGEAARVAEVLLQACPALRVLATSREALGIPGETLWPVPPMSGPDAAALFVDRATAVGGLDAGHDAEPVIDDVCTRLDGLPLAIELAAARTRAIPVQQLATRLDDRFRLLTGGTRTAMPRQQTLRAVVEWSYDLLFEDEQAVFDRLAVFAGGCSLDAAEVVGAAGGIEGADVADILARLVDKSLVVADRTGGEARFTLLQTLTLFARDRLASRDDSEEARDRHAACYGEICARGPAAFMGAADQAAWLAEARREADNIRAALAWLIEIGDADGALALVGGLGWSFWLGGGEAGIRLFDAALACPGPATAANRARATMWASAVRANAGVGFDLAVAMGDEARALWREAGDDEGYRDATALLAGIHQMRADRDAALAMFDEAAALYSPHPDHWSQAVRCSTAGRAASVRGQLPEAAALQKECVAHFEAAGVTWALTSVTSDVAIVAELQGDYETAVDATTKAMEAARLLGMGLAEVQMLTRLGNLALLHGDPAEADTWHDEALALGEEVGGRLGIGFALNWRAIARRRSGDLDEAATAATAALAIYQTAGAPIGLALALTNLGFVAELRGDLEDAERLHHEALRAVEEHDRHTTALAIEGLAGVRARAGDGEAAAALLGRAARIREEAAGTWSGAPSEAERLTAAAGASVEPAAFERAYERGASASLAELLAERASPVI